MIREFGGQGRCAFGVRNEEARKIGRFGTRMKMRSEDVKIVGQFLRFPFFFMTHACDTRQWNESKENGEGGGRMEREGEKERSTSAVKYHLSWCRIRFTAISFAICRS